MKNESNRLDFDRIAQFATNPRFGKVGSLVDAIEIQLLDGRTSQNTAVHEVIAKRSDSRCCQQFKAPRNAQSTVSPEFLSHTTRSRWPVLESQPCFSSDRTLTIECSNFKNT